MHEAILEKKLSLDWFLGPVSKDEFFANYFEKKHLHIQRSDSTYYSDLLSIEKVDELIYSQTLKFPTVKMTNAKVEIQTDKYAMGDRILPSQVIKYFSEGATLILSGLHDYMASLGKLCSMLTKELGHKFQTNIYITPKESQGFDVHYDTHDVFILQVKGKKKWRLYTDNPIKLPSKLQEFEKGKYIHGPLSHELILNEGDLLYIPRGIMHDADTMDETSMHITTGMLGFTWTDLLIEGILDLSKKDPELRKFIPSDLMTAPTKSDSFMNEYKDILTQVEKGLNMAEIVGRIRSELIKIQKPNISGVLQTAMSIEKIDNSTKFELRKEVIISVEHSNETITLEWSGKKVEFPIFTLPAIKFITESTTENFNAGDIPECLDEAGIIAILKRLSKEGLLSIIQNN